MVNNLTLEEVDRIPGIEDIVTLNSDDKDWKYNKDKKIKEKNIYDFQYEGISQLISRLDEHKVALLADEVGMGKTFQALSVISYYFNQKKDENFKVLIISPNNLVMNQWRREEYEKFYNNFLNIPKIIPIPNTDKRTKQNDGIIELDNLSQGFKVDRKSKVSKIVFAKTSSFQFGYAQEGDNKNIILTENDYKKRIEYCIKDIKQFDLIIIDEAHQYRNYYNRDDYNSNRVKNAKNIFDEFWNTKDNKRDSKLLLLTATPLHSTDNDVENIIRVLHSESSLLQELDNGKSKSQSIMNKIMIRRLKVMAKGKNKYDYRNEKDLKVKLSNENDIRNELFLAMLQKKYIESGNNKNNISRNRNLLDILEGSDFGRILENKEKFDENLASVVTDYKNIYGYLPNNNKYQDVLNSILKTKDCDNTSVEEKTLIFVRRTASAFNLSRQYIEKFDEHAWDLLKSSLDLKKNIPFPKDRDKFKQLIEKESNRQYDTYKQYAKKDFVKAIFSDKSTKEFVINRSISNRESKEMRINIIYEFFKEKESNFEFNEEDFNNFIKEYTEKISQFLPSTKDKDGLDSKYVKEYKKVIDNNYLENQSKRVISINMAHMYLDKESNFDYKDENDLKKLDNLIKELAIDEDSHHYKSLVLSYFRAIKGRDYNDAVYFKAKFSNTKLKFYKFFLENDLIDIIFPTDVQSFKNERNIYIQNILLIQSAILNASIGLVELYCCYLKSNRSYDDFKNNVIKEIKVNKLSFVYEIKELIENFSTFQENGAYHFIKGDKGQDTDIPDDKENQKIFYGSQPAYPYVANTKNDTVISRFNSPFFPTMLCGTSTLQVGVNLHRFCSKIYHFGAAHTMGDDEQRIGRVDRIKGKLHRELEDNDSTTLDIYYPYLENTFDEDNLKKMLCKKRSTEVKIDNLEMTSDSSEVECQNTNEELREINIKDLLHSKYIVGKSDEPE